MEIILHFILSHYDIFNIVIFCFTGAMTKDIYNTLTDKDSSVKVTRVLVSTITACILSYSFTDLLYQIGVSNSLFITIYYLSGLAGFDLLEKLSSAKGIGDFLDYIKDYFLKK